MGLLIFKQKQSNMEQLKSDVFESPKSQEEAFSKWQIATRMLTLLVAAGLVSKSKIEHAEKIARWEEQLKNE